MNTKIRSALTCLDAHDRGLWVKIGMAIKSELGDAGFSLWDSWGQTADNYRAADSAAVWRGIDSVGSVRIGSLFHEAKAMGWKYDGDYQKSSPLELAQQRAKVQREAQQKQHKRQIEQSHAAIRARNLWAKAMPADDGHPYLIRKKLQSSGLRQLGDGLLVPLSVDRQIVNIQFIRIDGSKRFLTGGQTIGAYCSIAGNTEHIYLCEGWATGATIRQLTGCAVVCAMSAHNLIHAGLKIRSIWANASLIIAADNDHTNKINTGLNKAKAAAERLNAHLVVPSFSPNETGADFNDRYLLDVAKGVAHVS